MKAIVVAEFKIADPERYARYTKYSGPAVTAAGGRYIAAGAPIAFLEGSNSLDRAAVVEFDSIEAAQAFHRSESYQRARSERQQGVEARLMVLPAAPSLFRADGWSIEGWARFWRDPDPEVAKRRVPTVVHPEGVVGYWPGGGPPVRGLQEYLQRILDLLSLVPDLQLKLEEHAVGGDCVFLRWTGTGTGPNGPFQCNGVDRIKLKDGLVIENRIISDHEIFRILADGSRQAEGTPEAPLAS
jgi:uncharacterized protein (DUF1330 family)